MRKNKPLLAIWEFIKIVYTLTVMIIILPFAFIAATSQITYEYAKTIIQTKTRKSNK